MLAMKKFFHKIAPFVEVDAVVDLFSGKYSDYAQAADAEMACGRREGQRVAGWIARLHRRLYRRRPNQGGFN